MSQKISSRDGRDHPFATALRAALSRSGMTLGAAAASVTAAGAPVTAATLSYWSTGRSRPARRSSIAVLERLEGVLELEQGTLLQHVDGIAAGATPAVPVPRHGAMAREIAELLEAWGVEHDDGLRRDLTTARRHLGPEHATHTTYDLLLLSEREGADRTVLVFAPPPGAHEARGTLTATKGCRAGRSARTAQGQTLHELILERPLAAGESTSIAYTWHVEGLETVPEMFRIWTVSPTRVLVGQVVLPEHDAPHWYRWSSLRSGEDGEEIEEDSGWRRVHGGVLQHVVTDVGLGQLRLDWSRSVAAPPADEGGPQT